MLSSLWILLLPFHFHLFPVFFFLQFAKLQLGNFGKEVIQ